MWKTTGFENRTLLFSQTHTMRNKTKIGLPISWLKASQNVLARRRARWRCYSQKLEKMEKLC
jgi:hypothetical protein